MGEKREREEEKRVANNSYSWHTARIALARITGEFSLRLA